MIKGAVMNEHKKHGSSFSSKMGFILAAAGSAVGLGNLWRFPYLAAKYGGGSFLLIYVILAVTFGFALMITEIALGRKTGKSALYAFSTLHEKCGFIGILASIVPIIILPYYCVIGGWVIKFAWAFLTGSGNAAAADDYFSNAIMCACLLSIVFILVGLFAPDRFLRLMGADDTITALGTCYTRTFLMFTPFFMCNYIVSAYVRNDNDPSRAMIATLCGSLFNIVFDYIFMFPMKLGLLGAAMATAASPVCSILVCLTHFFGKNNTVVFKWHFPSLKMLWESCMLGTAAFIGEIASAVTTTVFNMLLLSITGNIGIAAYGVVANYAYIGTAIFNGIAQGTQPLISECYGRGDRKDAERLYRMSAATAVALFAVIYIIVFRFTDQLVALFNSEGVETLAVYAHSGMIIYFAGFLFAGFNIVSAGYFSAVECAKESFVVSLLRGIVLMLIMSISLSKLFGMTGVWSSFPATELITAVVCVVFLILKNNRMRKHNNI